MYETKTLISALLATALLVGAMPVPTASVRNIFDFDRQNIYNLHRFETKLPHRGAILFRTVEDAGSYNYKGKF